MKKKKIWKSKKCSHKSPSVRRFWNGIYSELMPEGALTPLTACDAYRYFAGRASLSTSQTKVTHRIFITNGLYHSA